MHVWTAAATSSGGGIETLANYGVLGIFAIILLGFGLKAWQREIARADRMETELREKNTFLQDRVIPALTAAAAALEESQVLLRDITNERDRERNRR